MLKHHEESIQNLIDYFKKDKDVVSIILGGSVAKGCERADSDIDAIVIVTQEKYNLLEKENKLSECIFGYCTYENGYFDIKYSTMEYLKQLSIRGSEPSRNALVGSKCVFGDNNKIQTLICEISKFQIKEKPEKMLSFYSAFNLNYGYFWGVSSNNPYLRLKVCSDIVLFGLRLILQNNEVLFPCHKSLLDTIKKLSCKPQNIISLTNNFIASPNEDTKNEFVNAVLEFIEYAPPKNYDEVLTRFIDDNELWWYKKRPVIAEW